MPDSEKLQSVKSQIKTLEQKKITLTDADEIKAVNKQINALQEEFGRLRDEIKGSLCIAWWGMIRSIFPEIYAHIILFSIFASRI